MKKTTAKRLRQIALWTMLIAAGLFALLVFSKNPYENRVLLDILYLIQIVTFFGDSFIEKKSGQELSGFQTAIKIITGSLLGGIILFGLHQKALIPAWILFVVLFKIVELPLISNLREIFSGKAELFRTNKYTNYLLSILFLLPGLMQLLYFHLQFYSMNLQKVLIWFIVLNAVMSSVSYWSKFLEKR